jgi:ATP-dependent Clp protease ATP-binding subunit ClpA
MAEQQYTNKVIEAINTASDLTKEKSLPSIDVPILLRVLFDQENSMYVNILKKLNIDVKKFQQ